MYVGVDTNLQIERVCGDPCLVGGSTWPCFPMCWYLVSALGLSCLSSRAKNLINSQACPKLKIVIFLICSIQKSLHINVAAKIYLHKSRFKVVYPINIAKSNQVREAISQFTCNYDAPANITFDGEADQTRYKMHLQKIIRKSMIDSYNRTQETR